MKKLFIISSKSGKSDYKKYYDKLLINNSKEEIKVTKSKDDARNFARKFRDAGGDVLILLGGDGVLSEVASVVKNSKTALGLIPMGTANDFSKNFDYSNFNIENLEINKIEKIDLIEVNNETCINITSLGFDTNVLVHAYDIMNRKNIGKNLGYIYGVTKSILNLENTKLEINAKLGENETNIHGNFLISALCNGSFYGNGFNPSPNGKINDGVLNLIIAEKMSILKLFSLIMSYRKGNHLGTRGVREIQTTSGALKSDREFLYNIDGEIKKANKINYKILEKSLNWVYFK